MVNSAGLEVFMDLRNILLCKYSTDLEAFIGTLDILLCKYQKTGEFEEGLYECKLIAHLFYV